MQAKNEHEARAGASSPDRNQEFAWFSDSAYVDFTTMS
jgi:hypothetical protein